MYNMLSSLSNQLYSVQFLAVIAEPSNHIIDVCTDVLRHLSKAFDCIAMVQLCSRNSTNVVWRDVTSTFFKPFG